MLVIFVQVGDPLYVSGFFLKSRVSEICVERIQVNQGVGVFPYNFTRHIVPIVSASHDTGRIPEVYYKRYQKSAESWE